MTTKLAIETDFKSTHMTSSPFVGIGLRHPHYHEVLEKRPALDWFEVHSENFFDAGGPSLKILTKIRDHYPISLHGIGLSLGSADGLQKPHLARLAKLVDRIDPFLFSEHLSWGRVGSTYLPDLLPIPYTQESLDLFCKNVGKVQDFLKREILIENPSSYLEYKASTFSEVDFLIALAQKTGAKILLDVNNVYVSCCNHGWDAKQYINSIPSLLVKEIHLAGHSEKKLDNGNIIKIDTHDHPVCSEVWDLYEIAAKRFGCIPTLLERDANIPALDDLLSEVSRVLDYFVVEDKVRACA